MAKKVKTTQLSDRDWEILVTLAAGYLSTTNGDLRRAMSKAMAAHHDLILAVKQEAISAETPDGRVALVVPETGGIALRLEPR